MENSEGVIKKTLAFLNLSKVAKYFTPSRGIDSNEVFKTFYSKLQNQIVKKLGIHFLVVEKEKFVSENFKPFQ